MKAGQTVRFCPGASLFGDGAIPHAEEVGRLVERVKLAPGEERATPARWLVRFHDHGPLVECFELDLREVSSLFEYGRLRA